MNRYLYFGVVMGIVALLLGGCTAGRGAASLQPSQQSVQQLPSWFLNPPGDDRNSYFGAGEGRTKREAQNSALTQIASKISLNLKSTMQSSQRSYRMRSGSGDYESTREKREQQIEASVKAMEFSNFNVMNTHFQGNRFYTLVEVDRQVLFNRYHDRLLRLDSQIAQAYRHAQAQPLFRRVVLLDSLQSKMDEATLMFPLLKAISPSFDEAPYYQHFDRIDGENKKLKSRLVIGFKPTKTGSILASVKEHLAAEGIETLSGTAGLKHRESTDVAIVEINLSAKEQHFKTTNVQLADAHFALVSIDFVVYDAKGRVLARNMVEVRNMSKKSFQDAVGERQKFDKLANEKGILALLSGVE